MAEAAPQRIGRYEVLAELGQGAMGIVYKARDPQLERIVAIKTLRRGLGLPPEEYADLKRRFYQEAKAAGRLKHANIVTVYDVVEIEGIPYIVMEFLEGRTLAELIGTQGALDSRQAVDLVVQICKGLDYAHGSGVVHRDIKPGNIMVGPDGVAKVSDFGIARIVGSSVTRTGVVVGTPAYMSPEQLKGRVPDGRSDLFSVGVVLYESLTGVNPFQSDDLTTTLYQVVQVDPAPVRERNPSVPLALERVTTRVLAKDPDQRYPTAGALAEALTEALQRAGGVADEVPTVRWRPRPRLTAARAAVIGAGCLVVAGVGGWFVWGRGPTQDAGQVVRPSGVGGQSPGPTLPQPEPVTGRPAPGPVRPGEVVVITNPSVEVFLDGALRGRASDAPFVIKDVPAGERVVTLRQGSRQHELQGTVTEGQALWLTYRFPDQPGDMPLDKLMKATGEKILGTAREKLREITKEGERVWSGEKPGGRPPEKKTEGR